VIATGEQHSVRDFVDAAAREVGIALSWEGNGADEVGRVRSVEGASASRVTPGDTVVRVDRRYFRPAEVDTLLGNAAKARAQLGWSPEVRFPQLVAEMMRGDLRTAQRDELVMKHGHSVPTRNSG
jgi:GDPmannose 4,6-dehydratase